MEMFSYNGALMINSKRFFLKGKSSAARQFSTSMRPSKELALLRPVTD
jgi:hypothetical protein